MDLLIIWGLPSITLTTESSALTRISLSLYIIAAIRGCLSINSIICPSSLTIGISDTLALVAIRGPPKASSIRCCAPIDGRKEPTNLLFKSSSLLLAYAGASICSAGFLSSRIIGFAEDSRSLSSTSFTYEIFLISSMSLNITAKGFFSLALISLKSATASGLNGSAIRLYPPAPLKAITLPLRSSSAAPDTAFSLSQLSPFCRRHKSTGPQSWHDIV